MLNLCQCGEACREALLHSLHRQVVDQDRNDEFVPSECLRNFEMQVIIWPGQLVEIKVAADYDDDSVGFGQSVTDCGLPDDPRTEVEVKEYVAFPEPAHQPIAKASHGHVDIVAAIGNEDTDPRAPDSRAPQEAEAPFE